MFFLHKIIIKIFCSKEKHINFAFSIDKKKDMPKRTFQPSNRKRKNKHGFHGAYVIKADGQKVIIKKKSKRSEQRLTVSDEMGHK